MCVVCVLCKDFRLVQQWEAEQLARCQLHWEVIWVEGRAEQLWSAAACEKCCSYTPTRNPIHYETEACLLALCHTEHKRLWIGALTSAGESVCLSKYLGHLRRLQCAYMSVRLTIGWFLWSGPPSELHSPFYQPAPSSHPPAACWSCSSSHTWWLATGMRTNVGGGEHAIKHNIVKSQSCQSLTPGKRTHYTQFAIRVVSEHERLGCSRKINQRVVEDRLYDPAAPSHQDHACSSHVRVRSSDMRSAHCSLYLWNEESGIVLQLVYKLVSSKRKCQCCKEALRHWHCDILQHANLWGQIHQLRHETCSTHPWPHVTMKTSRTTQMWQMCSCSGLEMTIGCQEIMDVAINEASSTKYFMLEKAKHVRDSVSYLPTTSLNGRFTLCSA